MKTVIGFKGVHV